MNAWVLDTNFRAISFLDVYISLIWTERYNSYGDFELYCRPDDLAAKGLYAGNYIQVPDSDCVMRIEDHTIETDPEDGNTLTVTGKSLESILSQRIVWTQTYLEGSLQDAVKSLINDSIINPEDEERKISNFIFRKRWDSALTTPTVDTAFFGESVETAIESMLEVEGLGYKIELTESGQDFFTDCYKVLGEGWAIDTSTNKISYQQNRRSNCIIFECRAGKTYTFKRNLRTYGWTIGTMVAEPTDTTVSYDITASVAGNTVGGTSTLTAGASDCYIVIQAYANDYPSVKTLDGAIDGLSAKASMDSDYPIYEFSFKLEYGKDRSYDQSDIARVIFSPRYDNLGETSFVSSTKTFKSVALTVGEGEGSEQKVHSVECESGAGSGLTRYEMFVDASSMSSDTGNIFDSSSYDSLPVKQYFDYDQGSIVQHANRDMKCILVQGAPNTKYSISRTYEDRKAFQYQIGAFTDKPSLGSTCISGQKWKSSKMWSGDVFGQYGKGNIDLWNRPMWTLPDGTYETLHCIIFKDYTENKYIVIPAVYRQLDGTAGWYTNNEAIAVYRQDGLYLGKFLTRDEANTYAKELEETQKLLYPNYASSIQDEVEVAFTTGDNVNWLAITICELSTSTETFATLTEGLSINGTLTVVGYENKLDETGLQKLAENKKTETFEGTAIPGITHKYGVDYFMGDVVTVENEYGMTANQRITEFIRSQTANSYTEIPTFTAIEEEEEET